jgi:hypothetical protein
MNKFDAQGVGSMIADAEILETISIPSPTFQRRHKYLLAKTKLGDEASKEDLEEIEKELETAFSPEAQAAESRPLVEMMDDMEMPDGEMESEDAPVPSKDRRGFSLPAAPRR